MESSSFRRIAQWQSASLNTEEVAAFDSCSAYQFSRRAGSPGDSRPSVLFLSHCVPDPPDKGERIRAHHALLRVAERHRVHLACFARSESEAAHARRLAGICESVYVEVLPPASSLLRAVASFALGGSLAASYFDSGRMRRHVARLQADAAVVYCSVMGAYVPARIPIVADIVDVDSEKWLQYGRTRRPGFLYWAEARRLRQVERSLAARSVGTFVTTRSEMEILLNAAPMARAGFYENGVDFDAFDPAAVTAAGDLARTVVFVGEMNYFPNADAACWFARECFPELRRIVSDARFAVVGRNPSRAVRKLGSLPGVDVTGRVPDVRPWLAGAGAVTAPLRLARGIQNKVLEALAMGRRVFASPEVCLTFEPKLPAGVVRCDGPGEWANSLARELANPHGPDPEIRRAARQRFSWERNLDPLLEALEQAIAGRAAAQQA